MALRDALAVAVGQREDRTFTEFYEDSILDLTRALTATLGDVQLAQDAAQEAMARACVKWDTIRHYDNAGGWCYRVGRNWATSRWRKRRREVLDDRIIDLGSTSDPDRSEDHRLAAALRKLPIEQREVVVLRLVQDWSIAETAQALDIPPGTVQSRYSRALQRLRQILEAEDEQ